MEGVEGVMANLGGQLAAVTTRLNSLEAVVARLKALLGWDDDDDAAFALADADEDDEDDEDADAAAAAAATDDA